jgi:hypothetical protein
MGNFSKDPLQVLSENLAKGYIGLHLQQGVPLLDRDVNLMQDFLLTMVRQLAAAFFGNGIFPSDENAGGNTGFRIQGDGEPNDFSILPGRALADGIVVSLGAQQKYSEQQADMPPLTTPPLSQAPTREDAVYLDVWLGERTAADEDEDEHILDNAEDIGVETSVRLRPEFLVRVAEGSNVAPPPAVGHVHIPLAVLKRPNTVAEIQANQIQDVRRILVTLPDLDQRLLALESAAPIITGFTPQSGKRGSEVKINGANFDQANLTVTFVVSGNLDARKGEIVRLEPTQIVVKVPNFPGAGGLQSRIRVEVPSGPPAESGGIFFILQQ